MPLEPVAETQDVLNSLKRLGDEDAAAALQQIADLVQSVVPECVGLSLALHGHGLTFTLVASDEETAALDAVQYLDGGPCIASVDRAETVHISEHDVLDESGWQLYAQVTAAAGIASSLSLPILLDGVVVGGVNLYAATADAFEGHVEQLAAGVGGHARDAVMNADLDFTTRARAASGPEDLANLDQINQAAGMIAESYGIDLPAAGRRLTDAAAQAGLSRSATARAIIAFLSSRGGPRTS
ncbi:MAG: antitermination regulator [Marmoricola sp.]|nr:antitermination regulator [Marmoricola sp.]